MPILPKRGLTPFWATLLAAAQFAIAVALAITHAAGAVPAIHQTLANLAGQKSIALTVRYDGMASLMLAMVSFIGWVICRYSIRYQDGLHDVAVRVRGLLRRHAAHSCSFALQILCVPEQRKHAIAAQGCSWRATGGARCLLDKTGVWPSPWKHLPLYQAYPGLQGV